jgi:hypothetical protein
VWVGSSAFPPIIAPPGIERLSGVSIRTLVSLLLVALSLVLFGVGAVLSAEILVEGATWDAFRPEAINEFIPDR